MTIFDPTTAAVIRSVDAEVIGGPPSTGRMLLDSSATGGALSTVRITLGEGADGAVPHTHTTASELFYVLDGRAQVLAGEKVVTLEQGDVAVVPPDVAHAFAAAPGSEADLLIVITPGVERFEHFRLLARLKTGEATLEELLESQERFDNHFLDSPAWKLART
ncbi:mannose-6-phosphate isomerase-like protein (cupin superfamily) [Nonomuraea fuscirosea]|uniref:Mannose-6-phosphate isomerase-like protein (Cupin superfamily) n=1 Tax=Nonomuraea fuscirosea TaxID=1291556 RepID=A0A2T0MZ61_9ACTN|nr:cupin domain-containing protein [Nonomuraea fuscirosea]PRX64685.1 mannose-6-phosphate isomerase-like protein (cupin superfamily) [Nonomuraea fuscirosea]